LGSIIRKGGLGLPIVFAVAIFIIFHFINTFGKRVAQENEMSAFMGVWMSSMVLTPLAVLLTYRAINDIGGMISFDGVLDPVKKLFNLNKQNEEDAANETEDKAIETIKEELPVIYPELEIEAYNNLNRLLLPVYFISLIAGLFTYLYPTPIQIVLLVVAVLALFYLVFKSQLLVNVIATKTREIIEPGMYISLLVAFPFYGLIYLYYNRIFKDLKR